MKTIFIIGLLAGAKLCSFAQLNISSVKSGSWTDSTTWNTLTVPCISDHVTVSSNDGVTIYSSAVCADVTINTGGTLITAAASKLTVYGNLSNSGSYNQVTGTVIFNGSSPQVISGSSATTFYQLKINNATGVSMASDINIQKLLTISQGIFSTNNNKLTLLSDSVTTAALDSMMPGTDISGKISVQRYISSSVTGWRFLGSPVRTTLADWGDDFVTSGFPGSAYPNFYFCSVYSYDETVAGTSVNGYEIPDGITDSIGAGVGYWCWIGPTPSVVEVTGVPVRFNHTFSVSLTPDAGKNEDGWNMIANPYPSAIDWDSPAWTKTGIQDAIYIWDTELEQYSTYMNGISINGGSNIIPSSQAFWLAADQNSPVLSCTESVKVTADKTFLKNSLVNNAAVKLIVTGNGYKDETVVSFSSNSSQSVIANEDAIKLFSDNSLVPSITTICDSLELVVNSLPFGSAGVTVPVKVRVGVSGIYTITKGENYSLPLSCCVFLEDLVTGSYINLNIPVSYTFNISNSATSPRFLLHISKPLIKEAINPTCSYKLNGKAIAFIDEGSWDISWKDADGNVLSTSNNVANADTLNNLAAGTYYVLAQRRNSACNSVTEKITLTGLQPLAFKSAVENNNCLNDHSGSISALNVMGGTAPYEYKWSNNESGAEIKNLASGIYTLIVSDINGCSDTSFYKVKTVSAIQSAFTIANDTANLLVGKEVSFVNQSSSSKSSSWNFDNEVLTESTDASHTFLSAGTHTISLTVSNKACSSSTTMLIRVKEEKIYLPGEEIAVYGINEESAMAQVKFNLDAPAEATVTVYSAEGKLINISRFIAFNSTQAFALGESHGMYIVSVQTNGKNYTQKIIK